MLAYNLILAYNFILAYNLILAYILILAYKLIPAHNQILSHNLILAYNLILTYNLILAYNQILAQNKMNVYILLLACNIIYMCLQPNYNWLQYYLLETCLQTCTCIQISLFLDAIQPCGRVWSWIHPSSLEAEFRLQSSHLMN